MISLLGLVTGGSVSSSDRLRPFVDREVEGLSRSVVAVRAAVAPLLLVLAVLVAWVDGAPWRRLTLVAIGLLGIVGARFAAARVERFGATGEVIRANLVVTAAFQAAVITATGGVESPLLPALIPLALFGGMLAGAGRTPVSVVAVQVGAILILTAGHLAGWLDGLVVPAFGGGRTPLGLAATAAAMVLILTVATTVGVRMRGRIEQIIGRALQAHEGELTTWVDRSRELEAIGGEIAHELKNPLASIKGLAALVARDLPAGKAADRLGVLRSEVDRMQAILEGFLNFTRPLSPLELGPVDLTAACRHVAAMHEGTSGARRVVVEGAARPVHGDRRKLVQVLVNLVQNALDAAPEGSVVTLKLQDRGPEQHIEVVDQGPGPSPEVAARLFDPGVTSKPDGTGLGLPIARALARRHGGELVLVRDGRGTVARLSLPVGGPGDPSPGTSQM
jgi:two-component system sensor histidine kinase HydH